MTKFNDKPIDKPNNNPLVNEEDTGGSGGSGSSKPHTPRTTNSLIRYIVFGLIVATATLMLCGVIEL